MLVVSKIRAIFDAKYLDFIQKGLKPSSAIPFCEYVYWWLGKFRVDEETRKLSIFDGEEAQNKNYQRIQ